MIVFYNPHVDDFLAEPPHFRLLKRRPLKKYGFMFSEAIKAGNKIKVLVDATVSAFIPEKIFHRFPKPLRQLVTSIEFRWWLKVNDFQKHVELVELPAEDVSATLLAFSYKAATGNFLLRQELFHKFHAVVFHLSHYFVSTKEKSNNLRSLENVWLAGDSDITENTYFQSYFSWYKKEFLVLPFAVAPRFKSIKPYSDRDTRCIATGSFHDLTKERPLGRYQDYIEATGQTTYHPIRKAIYEQEDCIKDVIVSKVSQYRDYRESSRWAKLIQHFSVSQKKYFSIDIVELYNSYQFAVVGEELSGFPALGAFEAMACGCVLIGDSQYYKKLGMLPNEHYFPYDGTLKSLLSINANDVNKFVSIGQAGGDLVRHHFNPAAIFLRWNSIMEKINNCSNKQLSHD